jgi:hypothetical protein
MLLVRSALRRSRAHSLPQRRGWHVVASPGRLGDPDASTVPALLRAYLRALHVRPVAASAATATAAAAAGDLLAQLHTWSDVDARVNAYLSAESCRAPFSGSMAAQADRSAQPTLRPDASVELGPARTLRFAALTGVFAGGAGEPWFRALLGAFPGWTYEVVLRTVFDLALFAPAVLAAVVGGTALLGPHGDVAHARHKLSLDWAHSLGKMWAVWGGGAAVSYMLVPTPWQPPFAALLSVGWTYHVSRRVHLPTMRRDFAHKHSPHRVGAFIEDEASRTRRR